MPKSRLAGRDVDPVGVREHHLVADLDHAVGGLLETRDAPQGRALATPGRPQENVELPFLDLEINSRQRADGLRSAVS